jgi:tetratricopeptide (TPR) repeat protein
MSVDIIIKMGFFIADLHRHIEQLHNEQFDGGIFTVYRGQGMTKNELETMTKTKGGLLSFNCFLSTSKDRTVSLSFAESNVSNPDRIGILFVMTIDSTKSTTPFASVINVSYFHSEDEVLFSMHTVFRICDIKPMGENQRLFQVDLILTSDDDKDLRLLTNHIREETKGSTGWDQLGGLLLRMGQAEKAQQVYEILLKQTTEESAKVRIYNQLGAVKYDLGEYNEVIIFHEKSIAVQQQSLPLDHLDFSKSYNSMGMAYRSMGEYSKALSYYEKAFEISQKALPFHHPDLARSYNNIGMVYRNMGEYLKALSFHEKGLEILQKLYPPNHPGLAKSYNYIGLVYCNMREYSKALSYFEKALEIWQQSLPPNHPDLAKSRNNIGSVYYGMGEYFKALSFHEKAVEIWQKSFLLNHPRLAYSYDNIGSVYYNMAEYSKARSFYERAVEIGQQSLPTNHPELQKWKKIFDGIKNCN